MPKTYQLVEEHVTSIRLVCWWREQSVMFFVLMDVYVNGVILFTSTINWVINNYCDQLIRVTFGLIKSVSPYVLISNPPLCKPIKLFHFSRIFQQTSSFNPETAVRRITGNVVSFCQRTVTAFRSWTDSVEAEIAQMLILSPRVGNGFSELSRLYGSLGRLVRMNNLL
jgi:hypothetical protein